MRPRVGSSSGKTIGTFLRVANEVDVGTQSAACSVAVKGANPPLYKCYDRFAYTDDGSVSGSWKNYAPSPMNQCGQPPGPAALAGDIEVDLFEAWTMEQMRVSCIDTNAKIIYFTSAMSAPQSQSQINFRGPVAGHRFMIENVQDLLKAPKQWFLDRSKSPWTVSYLAAAGEDPNAHTVVAPQAQPVVSFDSTSWVDFEGIIFEMDNYVPPAAGFNADENGESSLPSAVDCESCQHLTFDGVTVRHTSANGLQFATKPMSMTPAAHDTVQNSLFYDLGSSGVHIGHDPSGGDHDAEVVQFILVQNNLVQGYSRVFADGEGPGPGQRTRHYLFTQ